MSKPILEFRNVSFGYLQQHDVLHEVSFELGGGKAAAILGPNGVGKTTLLYLALGWLAVRGGEVLFDGHNLMEYSRQSRGQNIALVPQSEHSPFDYSVFEYVLMGRAPHLPQFGMPKHADYEAAMQALNQVGIGSLGNQSIPQLSAGERQLMLVARAITQKPRLLLLDEPTAHLDLQNKLRIIRLLHKLRSQGVSLLMASHEPDVVQAVADDVILMQADRPVQFGPLQTVFTAENLTRLYGIEIKVLEIDGHMQVLWT